MRMMALKGDPDECWCFLGILTAGVLLVVCALLLGPWLILARAFRMSGCAGPAGGNEEVR